MAAKGCGAVSRRSRFPQSPARAGRCGREDAAAEETLLRADDRRPHLAREARSARDRRQEFAPQADGAAFKRALAAGVTIVFGSGATSSTIPHGRQADQFAYFVKWGMTPAQALQTAFLPAARMLNYGWDSHIGSIEKG